MVGDEHDTVWVRARLATMAPGSSWGSVEDAALAVRDGRLSYVGPASGLGEPGAVAGEVYDAAGRWITPGLIDCHTHLVHGGNRAGEWERRLEGATYEEIAREGGGILSTVRSTRAADEEALLASALRRLDDLLAEGVTTVEVKSGYGLDFDTELRMLRVARRLERERPVSVATSYLGAHAVPPEHRGAPDRYIDEICADVLPAVAAAGLADAVDAFCEKIAFTPAQVERVFAAAQSCGLPVKLHAEQLSDSGGAQLVARYGGLSADHLEHLSEEGAAALGRAGSVAVLLPGAFYFLRETRVPPVAALRRHRAPMALATDCNPGSSPLTSVLLALNLGCTLFRLTPAEALAGVTRNAAVALGLGDDRGTLEVGKRADFVLWEVDQPAELAYAIGANPCRAVVRGGQVVRGRF